MRTHSPLVKNPTLQKEYTGNWVARSLFALIDTPKFESSPRKMAEVLGTTIEEVVHAFEVLENLSLIKRTHTGYQKNIQNVYFNDHDLNPKSILSDHVLISTQIMGRLDVANEDQASFYRTGFFASNRQLVKEFCLEMERIMMSFIARSQREEADGVYSFSFSKVQVTQDEEEL